ncbi:MAG: methionyl-tRNA formyltransferase [Candidatus Helarchaeota archaeon]|nr:methionyl-tRNA formyltransferase [Candidatus Helarchaeota archaeon]
MNILFMTSSEFSIPCLDRIIRSDHKLVGIVTHPDKPKGRERKIKKSIIKEYSERNNIICLNPVDLKGKEFIGRLKKLNPEIGVIIAFRILPKEVFTIPKFGTINVHPSMLPEYRGAAPINWAIINGEKEIGLSVFFINEEVDKGDIILQKKISIGQDETAGEMQHKLSIQSPDLLMEVIDKIQKGDITAVQQKKNGFKKAPKIKPQHMIINWSNTALDIHNLVRGLSTSPGAYTTYKNKRLKVFKTKIFDSENTKGNPGSVYISDLDKGLILNTGKGMIQILELMKEGKKKMFIRDFLIGNRISEGEYFK